MNASRVEALDAPWVGRADVRQALREAQRAFALGEATTLGLTKAKAEVKAEVMAEVKAEAAKPPSSSAAAEAAAGGEGAGGGEAAAMTGEEQKSTKSKAASSTPSAEGDKEDEMEQPMTPKLSLGGLNVALYRQPCEAPGWADRDTKWREQRAKLLQLVREVSHPITHSIT